MRFGRGNLRGGNLIVETLILPHFLRLPRQTEVVTRYEKTLILPHFSRLPHSAEVVTSLSRGGNLRGNHTRTLLK